MKFRNILGALAIGVVVLTAAVAPSMAFGGTQPVSATLAGSGASCDPSTGACEPSAEPTSTSTLPSSPSASASSPSSSPSCDAACLAQCGADAACKARVVVVVNVVVGRPCPLVGQRGRTAKKEECSCKQTGSAPAEQPKWVLAGNTSPKAQSLPVTGASTMLIAVAGGLVLLVGAGVFVMARRRRVRFSA